jgi:hypothetical protein
MGNILSLACGLPLIGFISDVLTPVHGQQAIRYALALCAVAGVIGTIAHWQARNSLRAAPRGDLPSPSVPVLPRS